MQCTFKWRGTDQFRCRCPKALTSPPVWQRTRSRGIFCAWSVFADSPGLRSPAGRGFRAFLSSSRDRNARCRLTSRSSRSSDNLLAPAASHFWILPRQHNLNIKKLNQLHDRILHESQNNDNQSATGLINGTVDIWKLCLHLFSD